MTTTYDLTFVDSKGEEFPYSESLDGEFYYYRISIIRGDRDGELNIMNEGVHIEFDDGEWMDFNIPSPHSLFPNQTRLSTEDLKRIMDFLLLEEVESKSYSKSEMKTLHDIFKNGGA